MPSGAPRITVAVKSSILPTYHPEYYFEDGNLVMLAENVLFRVYRSSFSRHSGLFRDIFSLPMVSSTGRPEGSCDENPVKLPDVSKADFERLLWIVYPPVFGAYRAKTADEWASILDMATRWDFEDIRELAIRELQKLNISAVDKVVLARAHDIHGRWAVDAYLVLCERPDPLTISEARRLGLETTTTIAQLREQIRSARRGSSTQTAGPRASVAARDMQDSRSVRASLNMRRVSYASSVRSGSSESSSVGSQKARVGKLAASSAEKLSHNTKLVVDAFGLESDWI